MTKKQKEKQLAFEGALIEVNHGWWHQEIQNTVSELESLINNGKFSKTKENRIKFLENRLAYLEKKGNFENKNIKVFHKKIKKFEELNS